MQQRVLMLVLAPKPLVLPQKMEQRKRSLEQELQYLLYEFVRRYLIP
jgi:hypothetical protein